MNELFIVIILIGWRNNSWGYHSYGDDSHSRDYDGNIFHRSTKGEPYGPAFMSGDTVGCCLNFINNTVFYTKNGVHLGNYCTLCQCLDCLSK